LDCTGRNVTEFTAACMEIATLRTFVQIYIASRTKKVNSVSKCTEGIAVPMSGTFVREFSVRLVLVWLDEPPVYPLDCADHGRRLRWRGDLL
jgi:hypothetical protein